MALLAFSVVGTSGVAVLVRVREAAGAEVVVALLFTDALEEEDEQAAEWVLLEERARAVCLEAVDLAAGVVGFVGEEAWEVVVLVMVEEMEG